MPPGEKKMSAREIFARFIFRLPRSFLNVFIYAPHMKVCVCVLRVCRGMDRTLYVHLANNLSRQLFGMGRKCCALATLQQACVCVVRACSHPPPSLSSTFSLGFFCCQADPGVQGGTVASHRRNNAENVPQHHAQLRSHANIQEVRGVQLHREAGERSARENGIERHLRTACSPPVVATVPVVVVVVVLVTSSELGDDVFPFCLVPATYRRQRR